MGVLMWDAVRGMRLLCLLRVFATVSAFASLQNQDLRRGPSSKTHGQWRGLKFCPLLTVPPNPSTPSGLRWLRTGERPSFVSPVCCDAPQQSQSEQSKVHNGSLRTVWRMNTLSWLDGTVTLDSLPPRYNIITSLPDISEIGSRRRKMSPAEYEQWFINVVFLLLNRLPPDQVAIFYQTPGRNSGVGGEWLDKGLLCQLGAREAGARVSCLICLCNRDAVSGNNTPCYQCVWQKIVLDSAPGIERAGRPGFINMLCFSKAHTLPDYASGFKTVDVLERGAMAYEKAMGVDACLLAVDYCLKWVDSSPGAAGDPIQDDIGPRTQDDQGHPTRASDRGKSAVLDPFCGYGSVLAAANKRGADAYGIDTAQKCCRKALNLTV